MTSTFGGIRIEEILLLTFSSRSFESTVNASLPLYVNFSYFCKLFIKKRDLTFPRAIATSGKYLEDLKSICICVAPRVLSRHSLRLKAARGLTTASKVPS